jgi:NTP-dependent ternary system trypsin peptidase co-occuring protein
MDIESFVSEALEQLGSGISKARGRPGIRISPNPYTEEATNTAAGHAVDRGRDGGGIITFVEFDLSVIVTKSVEGSAGAKAKLEVIGLDLGGAELKGGVDHTRVQRIKFQVPVSFPEQS